MSAQKKNLSRTKIYLTLDPRTIAEGRSLADKMRIPFSRLVDELIRTEAERLAADDAKQEAKPKRRYNIQQAAQARKAG